MFKSIRDALFVSDEGGADTPTAAPTSDVEALLANLHGSPAAAPSGTITPPTPAPTPAPVAVVATGGWVEGRPFEELYAEAGVPVGSYPVERFLAVADGLKAMGPQVAKQALAAMDAGDASWSAADVRSDQQAKLGVLAGIDGQMDAQVTSATAARDAAVTAADETVAEATSLLREQIAELEAQITSFAEEAGAEKAGAEAALEATTALAAREKARVLNATLRLTEASQYLD